MKKIIKLLLPVLAIMTLVACGNENKTKEADKEKEVGKVTLVIEYSDSKKDEYKNIPITKDSKVIDVLEKEDIKVDMKDGFITAIDGVKQDEKAKKYWLYNINDKMAEKGVKDQEVKDKDKIDFKLGGV